MTVDLLAYLACAVAVTAVLSRIWATRGLARQGEIRTLCFGALLVGLSALLLAPATNDLLGRLETRTGVDVLKIVGDALRLAAAGAAGLLATRFREGRAPSSRTWLRWLLVVEVTLVACFFAADFHTGGGGAYVRASPGFGAAYDSIRLVYPAVSLGLFLVAIWPYARSLPAGPARAGSQILALAAVSGIAWTCWTVDDIRQLATVGRQDNADDVASVVLEICFVVAAATGMTVAAWDRFARATREWLRAVSSYRAMAPLWHALCGPDVAVSPMARPLAMPAVPVALAQSLTVRPWLASIARYRRVIEIRDAQLALAPYRPFGHESDTWTPEAEAAAIVVGLQGLAGGLAVRGDAGTSGGATGHESRAAAASIEAEADRLVEVTRAFVAARRRLPVVV